MTWRDRRRRHLDQLECDDCRGRRDYSLGTARTSGDEFVPDASILAGWACRHLRCCPRVARRILALTELRRGDDAATEALYYGIASDRAGRTETRCLRTLRYQLKRYEKRWNEDFERWWDSRPKSRHLVIDVENEVRHRLERRGSSKPAVAAAIEELAGKNHITLVWPPYVDGTVDFRRQVEQVFLIIEEPLLAQGRATLRTSLDTSDLLDNSRTAKVTNVEDLFAPAWKHVEKIAHHLVAKTRSQQDWAVDPADDLLQEARIAVWRALGTYKGRSSFSTYAYTAIDNALRDFRGRHAREDEFQAVWNHALDYPGAATGNDPATHFDGWTNVIDVLRSTRDSDLLLLHAAGYKDTELAVRHGLHIKMRRHRAKNRLRRNRSLLEAMESHP
jgi:RNA polymerase sigma factor (sigma-70 family)